MVSSNLTARTIYSNWNNRLGAEVSKHGFCNRLRRARLHKAGARNLVCQLELLTKKLDNILEKLGFAVEWSDEWFVCDCMRAVRTSADSFMHGSPVIRKQKTARFCV